MALTFFHNCENDVNISNPPNYSAGDTTGTLINGGAFDTLAARVGTYGLRKGASVSGGLNYTTPGGIWPGSVSAPSNGVGAFALSMRTDTLIDSTGVVYGIAFRGTVTSEQLAIVSNFTGSGGYISFRLKKGSTEGTTQFTLTTTQSVWPVNTWRGFVCRFDLPGDKLRLEVYDENDSLIEAVEQTGTDLSGAIPADIDQFTFGQGSSSVNTIVDYDNVMVANTYDEPLQNNFRIATYADYNRSGTLILPHRSGGGFIDLQGNFRG